MSTPKALQLPSGVRRLTIETSRGKFAALEALPPSGVRERQPALLVPGYTGSKEDFLLILQALAAAGRQVVAIDMRGQFETPGADDAAAYRLGALAADVAMVANWLSEGHDSAAGAAGVDGGRGVHLLGHSLGGLVAREVLLAQAARISSLTLMSSGPGALSGPRALILQELLAELNGTGPDGLGTAPERTAPESTVPEGTAPEGAAPRGTDPRGTDPRGTDPRGTDPRGTDPRGPDWLAAEVERIWRTRLQPEAVAGGVPAPIIDFLGTRLLSSSPTGLRAMAETLLTCPDRTAALSRLDAAPLMVLYGENDDAWDPAAQEDMAARLRAQRICIPAAAHSPAVEAPETTASTLTSFWNATECRRARPTRTA